MRVQHIFNGHIYAITNHAIACNSIFDNKKLCTRFLSKVNFYLAPLYQILHYVLHDNQFQIIVKMASREEFEEYYMRKKGKQPMQNDIPLSTHIYSQEMANLLASTAIHNNRKFVRTGAIFTRRFTKDLA